MNSSKNQIIAKAKWKAVSKLSDSEWGSTVFVFVLWGQRLVIGAEGIALGIGLSQTRSRLVVRKGLAFAICPDGLVDCRDYSRSEW